MNKGVPADSLRLVRKVRFFPAPPEILKGPSVTLASGALLVVALDLRSRSGAGRRAGQALALQVVVDVVSDSRRPPAASWPGARAAGGGGRPATRGGRRRRAGLVLVLQVAVDLVSSSMRPAAVRRPRASAAACGDRGLQFGAAAGVLASL